jgi:hypothetical protein
VRPVEKRLDVPSRKPTLGRDCNALFAVLLPSLRIVGDSRIAYVLAVGRIGVRLIVGPRVELRATPGRPNGE